MTRRTFQAGNRFILATGVALMFFSTSCAPPKGVYHTVKGGQTLYRISRVYQVEEDTLARVNHLRDRSVLEVGQRLFIPGASSARNVPSTTPARVSARGKPPESPARSKPRTPDKRTVHPVTKEKPAKTTARPKTEHAAKADATPGKSSLAVDAKGKFTWPVRGNVVKHFGDKNNGASKGVEIAIPSGSVVRAAAAGKVTYCGNGITGYGNLIILRHDESFFTVYGFNEKNLVHLGEYVSKEQQIALSGTAPGGGSPRLHFEIRRGKEALNPIYILP
jgi:lipoprotein NlpD